MSKLDEGNNVVIETSYGEIIEGVVQRLTTFTVILECKHKRRPVEVNYKDIKSIILKGDA